MTWQNLHPLQRIWMHSFLGAWLFYLIEELFNLEALNKLWIDNNFPDVHPICEWLWQSHECLSRHDEGECRVCKLGFSIPGKRYSLKSVVPENIHTSLTEWIFVRPHSLEIPIKPRVLIRLLIVSWSFSLLITCILLSVLCLSQNNIVDKMPCTKEIRLMCISWQLFRTSIEMNEMNWFATEHESKNSNHLHKVLSQVDRLIILLCFCLLFRQVKDVMVWFCQLTCWNLSSGYQATDFF